MRKYRSLEILTIFDFDADSGSYYAYIGCDLEKVTELVMVRVSFGMTMEITAAAAAAAADHCDFHDLPFLHGRFFFFDVGGLY